MNFLPIPSTEQGSGSDKVMKRGELSLPAYIPEKDCTSDPILPFPRSEAQELLTSFISVATQGNYELYGGCIRDSLLGIAPRDIDIAMCKSIAVILTNIPFIFKRERETDSDYSIYRFNAKIGGHVFKLDVSDILDASHDWCDFTCNNLSKTGFRIASRCKTVSPENCIKDIFAKRLVPMFNEKFFSFGDHADLRIIHVKLIKRALTMMKRGWKLCPHVNGRQLKFDAAHDGECAICKEQIVEFKGIKLQCKHDFHVKCLIQLVGQRVPYARKCPLCRKDILF